MRQGAFAIASGALISTPVGVGHLSDRAMFGVAPRAAQGPKLKTPLPGSFVQRPTEYTCQVSSTSAQRSHNLKVLKMLTLHERTDARTNI